MKRALCIVSFTLLLTTAVVSQTTPQVILDVKASGFKVEPVGEHVYLRVYDNGLVEFDDYKASIRGFYLYESHLSPERLASLEDQLKSFTVSDIAASYPLKTPMKGIVRHVRITIPQPNGFQVVEIIAGGAAAPKGSDTKALIGLLCTIEKTRKGARFRFVDMRKCQRRQ